MFKIRCVNANTNAFEGWVGHGSGAALFSSREACQIKIKWLMQNDPRAPITRYEIEEE